MKGIFTSTHRNSGLDQALIMRKTDPRKDWRILTILLFVIIASALGVSYQVYLYRDSFQQLQRENKQRERLDEEWGRLLIEQQTFGAITQVGSSAVLKLQMYSPRSSEIATLTQPTVLNDQVLSSNDSVNEVRP